MKTQLLPIALLSGLALLGGCQNNKASEPKASMGIVNAKCPIVPADELPANPATVEFKGQKVGFCCPGCISDWNRLSDEQKQARIDKYKK